MPTRLWSWESSSAISVLKREIDAFCITHAQSGNAIVVHMHVELLHLLAIVGLIELYISLC